MSKKIYDKNNWFEIKNNPISKVGVFQYSGEQIGGEAGRIYNVYRSEEELSDPETLDSFRLLPIIDNHTMLGDRAEGLTPAEDKKVHGVIGDEVKFEDGYLTGNLKIFSDKLKKLIQGGKRELSCGYRCVYKFVSGEYNGQNYDAIQTQLRGNHLALVDAGRMGSEVAVLDGFTFTIDSKEFDMTTEKTEEKKELTLDGISGEVAAIAQGLKDLTEAVAKLTQGEKKEEETLDVEQKEDAAACDEPAVAEKIEAMDAEIKSLKSSQANSIKDFAREISARDALASKISQHIGTFDHADKTLAEVAKYGVEKLGIKCDAGQERAALDGFLHNREVKKDGFTFDHAAKKKSSVLSKYFSAE